MRERRIAMAHRVEILAEPEVGGGEHVLVGEHGQPSARIVGGERERTRRTLRDPVAHGIEVGPPHALALGETLCAHLLRRAIELRAKRIARARGFGRPYDAPGLVDPHGVRDVDHAVELGHQMTLVDQARIRRLRCANPRLGRPGTAAIERDGEHHEGLVLQLLVERLPHGQVEPAASPGRPRHEKDFLAAMVGE